MLDKSQVGLHHLPWKSKLFWRTIIFSALISSVGMGLPTQLMECWLDNSSDAAYARSSGGRSSGGSFSSGSSSRSSSPSSSSSGSSSRSSSSSSSSSGSSSRSSSSSSSSSSSKPSQSTTSSPSFNRGNTGGRSGGGSFQKPAPPSSSNQSPTRRTYSPPNSSRNQPYRQSGGSTVIVPAPIPAAPPPVDQYPNDPRESTYPSTAPGTVNSVPAQQQTNSGNASSSTDSSSNFFKFLLLLLAIGCVVLWTYYFILKKRNTATERDNNIVTVSKLQVALLAQARSVQSQLSELSLNLDTNTPEGLLQLLQESALALLRSPENWTHVLSSSQTVKNRESAEILFNKLSFQERSKFSAETLTNMHGQIRQQAVNPNSDEEPAAYIVVTLIVGTADDRPLFEEIRTTQALKSALEKVALIRADYLMVFELLWSPQAETDSLTYDELLTEYTDMVQIA